MPIALLPNLLAGVSVLLAELGDAGASPSDARLARALGGLGAAVTRFAPELDADGEGGAGWVREQAASITSLVVDARGARGDRQLDGRIEPLRDVLDAAWIAVAAAVNGAFLAGGIGGRIVLVAPPHDAAWWAPAAADALENLARTVSVEWARFAILTTAVVPSTRTDPEHLETVVAFLLSTAGAYHTGSRLDLDRI